MSNFKNRIQSVFVVSFGFAVLSAVSFMTAEVRCPLPLDSGIEYVLCGKKADINKMESEEIRVVFVSILKIRRKKAESVIKFLKSQGKIKSVDELMKIKGIGPKTLEKLKKVFY